MAASGIRFNDCYFTEPISLAAWTPPKCAGLFSVLVNDSNWAPKGFQPLYFGEFGNNSPASLVMQEVRQVVAGAPGKTLAIAVLLMPFSTSQQRAALRQELIRAYNPTCQTDARPPHVAELAAQEQSAPMMRRRIGFVTT